MTVVLIILRLPAMFGLFLALLVCSGCGQVTSRHVVPDTGSVTTQDAVTQPADVVAEPLVTTPAEEQPTSEPQPLLFADERPEPYQPRGPPGLTFLPFFPAPLLLPADVVMPSELGVVVESVVQGNVVVAWAAVSPVGWRVGWLASPRTVGFRYYNPQTGRYISRDPAGYPNGLNNYLYVNNNPINRIDPHGLWFWDAVQAALDVVSVVPVVGNVASLANAGISVARGDMAGAAVNLAGAVPGVGNAIKAGSLAAKAVNAATKVAKGVEKVQEVAGRAEAAVDTAVALSQGDLAGAAMAAVDVAGGGGGKKKDHTPDNGGAKPTPTGTADTKPEGKNENSGGSDDVSRQPLSGANPDKLAPGDPAVPLGVGEPLQRYQGPWTERDIARGKKGQGPVDMVPTKSKDGTKDLPLELHHPEQQPGKGVHEVSPAEHDNPDLHPYPTNQGVTDKVRRQDREQHWKQRAKEMEGK